MASDDRETAADVLQALTDFVERHGALDAGALADALHEATGLPEWQCKLAIKIGLKLGQWVLDAGKGAALSRAEELLNRIPIVRTMLDDLAKLHVQAGARMALGNRLREQLKEPELLPLTAGHELLVAQFLLEQLPAMQP